MSYRTSEQLAQLLLQYGFVEKTKQQYPEDYKELAVGVYDASVHRRAFKYGTSFVIHFEQNELRAANGFYRFQCSALRDGEIKAILTYIQLPNHTKTAVQNRCRNILDLEKEYKRIKKQGGGQRGITDHKIVTTFESISLPDPE